MYFLTSFMVLLRQLRRLYASGSIFQVPPVYNYSTYYTNRVPTRFDTLSTRLYVRFAYASSTLLKYQLRGEVRQYIDHIACFNITDSHHPNKYMILHIFRARGYDSPVPLNWYKYIYLQNPSYNENIYYTFQLVVVKPFSCILVRQGLNHFNTLFNKNNPVQATYFINVSNLGPLLVILILTYIKNPFSLYSSPIKCLTDGILINQ